MKHLVLATALALLSGPVLAEGHSEMELTGNAENGDAIFNRQCVSCHVVVDDAGETLAGRNAQVGPNLYKVALRTAGTYPDFRYGDGLVAAGEAGVTWTEENFVGYVQDPTGWLREELDDRRARGLMSFQLRSEEDAHDVYAYLASFGVTEE